MVSQRSKLALRIILAIVMVGFFPRESPAGEPAQDRFPVSLEEHTLGAYPTTVALRSITFSADGSAVAYIASGSGGKSWVVLGGKKGEEFSSIEDLVLSPDGKTVAYKAQEELTDGSTYVVIGDQKSESFMAVHSIVMGPDGKTVAYTALGRDRKSVVVVGEKKDSKTGWVMRPRFSPDGTTVAYVVRVNNRDTVVVGEEAGKEYDEVALDTVLFHPDGKSVSYLAMGPRNVWRLVMAGKERPEFQAAGEDPVALSHDLQTIAYRSANRNGKVCVVVGNQRGPEFDEVQPRFGSFSPDGKTFAYTASNYVRIGPNARQSGPPCLVIGDRKGELPGAMSFLWSPDGKVAAYYGFDSQGQFIVLGDRRIEGHIEGPLILSPDGKTVAYVLNESGWRRVIAGETRSARFESIFRPVFSPDGKKLAFGAIQTDAAFQGREFCWKVMTVK